MTDLAVGLLRHGYGALEIERRRCGARRAYDTRLLGRRTVVVGGSEAARLFYDEVASDPAEDLTRIPTLPPQGCVSAGDA